MQIADLLAYVISWGFRISTMTKPAREELSPFADQVAGLRYRAVRERFGNALFEIWSFAHISDLRTQSERSGDLWGNKKGNEAPKRPKASTNNADCIAGDVKTD